MWMKAVLQYSDTSIFQFRSYLILCAMLFGICSQAGAQQQSKVARIGFLYSLSPAVNTDRIEAFQQGLRELGCVEGKNIIVRYRYTEGNRERLTELAAELVRLKVDVIVSGGPAVTRPAKEATATIPIVMAQDSNPAGNGFAASLARPGGNITGLSKLAPEVSGETARVAEKDPS